MALMIMGGRKSLSPTDPHALKFTTCHPMSQSSGFCDTSVPTPAPSREQLCSPQEFSLPQGFGQHLPFLCLSPGLKQAGKASLKFAASCVFFGLEIPSELYRRKVVGTSLLSQSHR